MAQNPKIQQNIRNMKISKDLQGISERAKKNTLKFSDLIIPLGSVFVLIILTIFVFLPMIKTARESREEYKEVNAKVESLEEMEDSLEEMDDVKLTDDLLTSKKIVPKLLQVADFVYYIDNLAQSKELETDKISASDISVDRDATTSAGGSLGVSSPISYKGNYENVIEFLDEIQEYSPYLVTLSNITFEKAGDEEWELQFKLTGYYIPEVEREVDFYASFTPYTNYPDIIDIFSVRVERLDE